MRSKKRKILLIVLCVLIPAVLFYRMLPPVNPLSTAFWMFLLISFLLDLGVWFVLGGQRPQITVEGGTIRFHRTGTRWADGETGSAGPEGRAAAAIRKLFSVKRLPVLIVLIMIFFGILSSSIFHAGSYSKRMVPVTGSAEDLPTYQDVSHISLMDTSSARILGNRVIGSLSDVVSQFEVSDDYTTLVYRDTIIKVSPLEYGSFFKFVNNRKDGAPGYVMVDTQSFDAKFIRTADAIRYSPSAYFGKNLTRHLRFTHPFSILGPSKFEIDEEGLPHWVTAVYGHRFLFGGEYVKGAIVTDPATGETVSYRADEIPEWVDNVYSGEFACELYNSYGMLRNGWINSKIGQKGCLMTTDDFGYLAKGNDLYIYTGVTSVNADESNLGFIMVNARSGGCTYVECAGAEEYSAMSAAQGVVQNYGYRASFPSLVTVNGVPTYVMVLKDNSGLVKSYAAVNVSNYTIVTVSSGSLNAALKEYERKIRSGVQDAEGSLPSGETLTAEIIVAEIVYADIEGNTFAYLIDPEDEVYRIAVAADETVVTVRAGDILRVEYQAEDQNLEVIPISGFERIRD